MKPPLNYIYMHSGTKVSPDPAVAGGIGTLDDFALALSRVPRFGGQTRSPWSVADHTLFMASLLPFDPEPALWLAVLLHDAHEALTGDIPTAFKTPDIRAMQKELDVRIMNTFFPGGISKYLKYKDAVKELDNRALVAEALVVGPPITDEISLSVFEYGFGRLPDSRDVKQLRDMLNLTCVGVSRTASRHNWRCAVLVAQREITALGEEETAA